MHVRWHFAVALAVALPLLLAVFFWAAGGRTPCNYLLATTLLGAHVAQSMHAG